MCKKFARTPDRRIYPPPRIPQRLLNLLGRIRLTHTGHDALFLQKLVAIQAPEQIHRLLEYATTSSCGV